MANTNTDALIPEFWFQAFDALDIGAYNLQNFISRDTEALLAKAGDTVNVPITPDLGDADNWVPGAAITATGVTQATVAVVLNKSKKKTIGLTGKELSLPAYDLIEKYGVPMAKTILRTVNDDIYKELLLTNQVVDGTAGVDEDDVVDAKTMLDNAEVGKAGRILVASPDDIGTLLKKDAFQYANYSGDNGRAMNEGDLMRKFGFNIYENNIIEKYTPADLTGAINNGNIIVGSTVLTVDGFADSANPVRNGDVLSIESDTSGYYTVTDTDVDTDGNTVAITITPGLRVQTVNDKVITMKASRSMLAMVPGCAAFAARSYAALPVGVMSAVYNFLGLPIRIVVWVDSSTLNVNVQYDILYGVKMVNDERVCRILTA